MVKTLLFLLLLTMVAAAANDGVAASRQKRSDDPVALQAVVDGLSSQVAQLTASLTALQTQMQAALRQVAFDVHRTTDFNVGTGATVVYDVVETNTGDGYDDHSGIFTAPVAGLYHLTIHCLSPGPETPIDLGLFVDDRNVAICLSLRTHGVAWDASSGETTLHMDAGSRAFVRNHDSSREFTGGLMGTTFSGFLIQADN